MSTANNKKEHKKEESYLFEDYSDNDEDDINKTLKINLSSESIIIKLCQFYKFSDNAITKYQNGNINNLLRDLIKYQQKYQLNVKNIKLFFECINEEHIQISINNYFDYKILSKKFKISKIERILQKYSKNHFNDVEFIIEKLKISSFQQKKDLLIDELAPDMEEFLSNCIIKCLQIQKFGELPLSTCDRIIKKSNIKIPNDLLFDFIKESLDDRYPLLSYINIKDLSEGKFNEMCNCLLKSEEVLSKKCLQFLHIDLLYFKEIKNWKEKHLKYCNQISKKFENNDTPENQFFYLCSLIIENVNNLITNPQSKLLYKHFNYNSDIVTILESINEIIEKYPKYNEDSGLNIFTIVLFYSRMEITFNSDDGRNSILKIIKWAREQPNGLIGMVNKYVFSIDQKELNKKKCEFEYIISADAEKVPTLVYKTKDDKKIYIYRRPGCHGLQSPGNIYVLSILSFEECNINYGMLVHIDSLNQNDSCGVVSIEIINNLFFFSLFEAYMREFLTNKNFVNIYKTSKIDEQSSILIYINNYDDKSILNYCPRSFAINKATLESIYLLSSLVAFVPRSIIINYENPVCVFEIIGYGSSYKFSTHFHKISDKNNLSIIPYPLNKETIEYASNNLSQLEKDMPKVRFAITGENFFDEEIFYPDVAFSVQNVFDINHPSHLVLLIDNDYLKKPNTLSLSWNSKSNINSTILETKLKWNLDKTSIPNILNKESRYDNTCICICDNPQQFLPQQIHVFHKDGSLKQLNICKGCIVEIFKGMDELENAINLKKRIIYTNKIQSMSRILPGISLIEDYQEDNATWPQIPLGQCLWVLLNNLSNFNFYLKSWFIIIVEICWRQYYTFCPNHPDIILEKPKNEINMKCSLCDMIFCSTCHKWHILSDYCLEKIKGVKYCPYCKIPVEKISGCSHIICHCGKNWCYKCENSPWFNTSNECYEHLKKVHGGYLE